MSDRIFTSDSSTALREDDRAASPVIGVILMVAIAILLVAVVGTLVFDITDTKTSAGVPPASDFEFDYKVDQGVMEVTYTGGDPVDPNRLELAGHTADPWTESRFGDQIESGDSVIIEGVGHDTEYRVVWEGDGGTTSVIESYTPESDIEYIFEYENSEEDDSDVEDFKEKFTEVRDDCLIYDDRGEYINWGEEDCDGENLYKVPVEEDTSNVTIRTTWRFDSYDGAGATIYVKDVNDNKYAVKCDGGGYIDCGNRGNLFDFTGTYTVDADAEIEAVYIGTDLANVEGWIGGDNTRLYSFYVGVDKDDTE